MLNKSSLLFIITMIIFSSATFAQSFGINFTLGFPQGEFKEHVSRTGLGIGGEILFPTAPMVPVEWGFDIAFINYGDETRRAPLSNFIPDLTVDVNRTNNIVMGHAMIRISPPSPLFKPYLDLLAGGSYIYTQTTLTERFSGKEKITDENFSDWAFSYGAGAGIMFSVYNQMGTNVMIDLKARYLFGTQAEYLSEGDVITNTQNGTVTYNTRRSKTDILTAQIGVNISFSAMLF